MDEIKTIILGFLGCGGIAALVFWLSSFVNKKGSILKAVHDVAQKIGIENIKDIEDSQVAVIVNDIKNKEELAEDSVIKIKTIQKKAASDIQEILKIDKLSKIQETIDNQWDSL